MTQEPLSLGMPISQSSKIVSKIWKYHNHKLPTNPWHREEEPDNNQETPGQSLTRKLLKQGIIIINFANTFLNFIYDTMI